MEKLFWLILIPSLLVGCKSKTLENKSDETLRQSVYAVNDSMNVGRFDIAKKYSDESIKLIPPPEKRVKIAPFIVEEE